MKLPVKLKKKKRQKKKKKQSEKRRVHLILKGKLHSPLLRFGLNSLSHHEFKTSSNTFPTLLICYFYSSLNEMNLYNKDDI